MYIGTNEVKTVENGIVTYVDGYTETYTETALKYLLTETPTNPTEVRDLIVENVSSEILDIFLAHNVPLPFLRSVIDGSTHALEMGLVKAQAIDSGITPRLYDGVKESAQEINARIRIGDIFDKVKQFDAL